MEQNRIKILVKTSLGHNGVSGVTMNYFKNISHDKLDFDFAICDSEEYRRKDFVSYIELCESRIFTLPPQNRNIIKYSREMINILKGNNYNIIHVNGSSAIILIDVILAKLCGVKVQISHVHNTSCRFKLLHFLLKPFLNLLVKDRLACSESAGKWLYYKNFKVIQNGINFEEYAFNRDYRFEIRRKYNIPEDLVMCHVGSFNETKNQCFLIDIFEEITKIRPNSRLLLIGDGPLKNIVEKKVIQIGLERNVIFVGNVSDVNKYYSAADIFVLPSKFEGLPLVLIEAQVAGLPCIISDNITKEVDISGKIDQLSISLNPKIWARRVMETFIKNSRITTKLNNNAKSFDIKKSSIDLEQFYIEKATEKN